MTLPTYLPQDRLRALARGETLPDRTRGSALFADISGFTAFTEGLRNILGPRRGAEELAERIEAVYSELITQIERFGGSVIDFAGDSMLCWFDDSARFISSGKGSALAVTCAFALQEAMQAFKMIPMPDGTSTPLAL